VGGGGANADLEELGKTDHAGPIAHGWSLDSLALVARVGLLAVVGRARGFGGLRAAHPTAGRLFE
jgi:hypothetical protein